MNMFKVGDYVVRKEEHMNEFWWKQNCPKKLEYGYFQVLAVNSTDILVGIENLRLRVAAHKMTPALKIIDLQDWL